MMIQLVPMTHAEFDSYLPPLLAAYADDHVRAGNWHAGEALQKAEAQVQQLLPEGVDTPNHYFFALREEVSGETVGAIWIFINLDDRQSRLFVYDLIIDEAHRRRGHGEQGLRALERWARGQGIELISLHVFGHNEAAIRLYEKLGFIVTDLQMTKPVP